MKIKRNAGKISYSAVFALLLCFAAGHWGTESVLAAEQTADDIVIYGEDGRNFRFMVKESVFPERRTGMFWGMTEHIGYIFRRTLRTEQLHWIGN